MTERLLNRISKSVLFGEHISLFYIESNEVVHHRILTIENIKFASMTKTEMIPFIFLYNCIPGFDTNTVPRSRGHQKLGRDSLTSK